MDIKEEYLKYKKLYLTLQEYVGGGNTNTEKNKRRQKRKKEKERLEREEEENKENLDQLQQFQSIEGHFEFTNWLIGEDEKKYILTNNDKEIVKFLISKCEGDWIKQNIITLSFMVRDNYNQEELRNMYEELPFILTKMNSYKMPIDSEWHITRYEQYASNQDHRYSYIDDNYKLNLIDFNTDRCITDIFPSDHPIFYKVINGMSVLTWNVQAFRSTEKLAETYPPFSGTYYENNGAYSKRALCIVTILLEFMNDNEVDIICLQEAELELILLLVNSDVNNNYSVYGATPPNKSKGLVILVKTGITVNSLFNDTYMYTRAENQTSSRPEQYCIQTYERNEEEEEEITYHGHLINKIRLDGRNRLPVVTNRNKGIPNLRYWGLEVNENIIINVHLEKDNRYRNRPTYNLLGKLSESVGDCIIAGDFNYTFGHTQNKNIDHIDTLSNLWDPIDNEWKGEENREYDEYYPIKRNDEFDYLYKNEDDLKTIPESPFSNKVENIFLTDRFRYLFENLINDIITCLEAYGHKTDLNKIINFILNLICSDEYLNLLGEDRTQVNNQEEKKESNQKRQNLSNSSQKSRVTKKWTSPFINKSSK